MANMLSELRKYQVSLTLAHQYLSQLDLQVRDAILGNAGTIISFRIGIADAEILEKEFYPEFSATDLIGLPNYNIYLKLMVEGMVTSLLLSLARPDHARRSRLREDLADASLIDR